MVYDTTGKKYEIGDRIRKERKEAGFKTQSAFALALGLQEDSRQSVGYWENGTRLPNLDVLLKMCELFECEIGYLLCEYDCKTKEITDIRNATGLSERALQKLLLFRPRKPFTGWFISIINSIVEHDDFVSLLEAIGKHTWSFNQNHYSVDDANEDVQETLANTFNCEPYELRAYIETSSASLIESILMKIVRDIE